MDSKQEPRSAESPQANLRRTVAGLLPVTAAAQVLGFASSVAMARYLGATHDTDAYYLALLLPGLASGVILAAMRQGAIPSLTDAETAGDDHDFSRAVSALVTGVTVIALALAVCLGAIGITVTQATMTTWPSHWVDRTAIYSALLIPYTAGAATQGALSAALAVRGSFRIAVAVYGLESLAKIAFVALLTSLGAMGLVLGNLVGQLLSILVLWGALRRKGVTVTVANPIRNPILRSALIVTAPLIVSSSVLQVNPLIDKGVAASLNPGPRYRQRS